MSAGMFEATIFKLNSPGSEVDFLIVLQSRSIIDMTRLLGFIAGNNSTGNFEGIDWIVLFFECRAFLEMASILGLITVTSSLL